MTLSLRRILLSGLVLLLVTPALAAEPAADETRPADPGPAKHLLRYRFRPGESLRWEVVHRKRIRATFAGSTQMTDSASRSTKCWRVVEVDAEGNATFESLVEDVDMRQRMGDKNEVHFNSKEDKKPPQVFENAAQRIGKPLARITLDHLGHTVHREPLMAEPPSKEMPQLTIPLPKEPVAVGESWRRRHEAILPLENGTIKTIQTQQVFTLTDVKTGVATIKVANQVLTPIHSPEIEAKLIERYSQGTVRFDIDAGKILSQQMDLDRQVIGFRGADSCLHYLTRFTERFLPEKTTVADRTQKPLRK